MKLAIVCAMLLGLFRFSAAASGEREVVSVSAPTPSQASISPPAPGPVSALLSASVAVPANTVASLPDAPLPAELRFVEPTSDVALASSPAAIITLKTAPKTHKFFDARNSLGLTSMAASLAADALSTQNALAHTGFYEMNPVARPFVKTRSGEVAYSGGAFALLVGTMYIAHKTKHHKLERILPFAVAGWESLLTFHNYRAIANRR